MISNLHVFIPFAGLARHGCLQLPRNVAQARLLLVLTVIDDVALVYNE